MVSVLGTYKNGKVELDKVFSSENPVKVLVTFLEDVNNDSEKPLKLSDFSFAKSQEILKDYKGSLSDAVIEERRSAL